MATEQQIRLNFLDEAEEYFNLMESNLLGLADTAIALQKVDLILRLAHSIKGGAAMMGLNRLSQVAHCIEDFLTILRIRYVAKSIDVEVETLLLQSLDCLRHLAKLNRLQLLGVDAETSSEIQANLDRTQAIFEKLRSYLGELEDADENALLASNEDDDPAVVIFKEGIKEVLDRFEAQLPELENTELVRELSATAQVFIGFGKMANIEAFILLCESIAQKAVSVSPSEITPLAEQALKAWKRSHALVLRGNIDRLPSDLEGYDSVNHGRNEAELKFETQEFLSDDFKKEFALFDIDAEDLSSLQSAFELDNLEQTSTTTSEVQNLSGGRVDKMVKVPASQFKQFNTLLEQLILDRNKINLRLEQLQDVVSLMNQRMSQMRNSNTQLKQWCDRTSPKELLEEKEDCALAWANLNSNKQPYFDISEIDRYSKIHLICQEQIETMVQLQEVATEIELGIHQVHQSARDLHGTTIAMQNNVTRIQMLPFADAVKLFPRVIRDLNLQFNKQVKLKIVGEETLLNRSVIQALSDPLIHLLRNSFAHGIEDRQIRIENGKPESGTITIQAKNQGAYSLIAFSDDGAGISLDKIRDRLSQMGLSRSEVAQISEVELLEFIFESGFSTAKQVTELSGRGVGLDIVCTNIQEVGGDVRVDTESGKGTTFTIKIPLTTDNYSHFNA